jgi:hypothetical protein
LAAKAQSKKKEYVQEIWLSDLNLADLKSCLSNPLIIMTLCRGVWLMNNSDSMAEKKN